MCAHHCSQLSYITQHRAVYLPSYPPVQHQSPDAVYLRQRGEKTQQFLIHKNIGQYHCIQSHAVYQGHFSWWKPCWDQDRKNIAYIDFKVTDNGS